jgi:O-antigen/teichoic acid export membrane protein
MGGRELGIFSAVNYLPQAGLMIAIALGATIYPRLAALYFKGDLSGFKALLGKGAGISLGLGLTGLLLTSVVGSTILRLLYRPEYANHSHLLHWMMAIMAVACPASCLGCALTATSRFHVQVPLFLAVTAVSAGASLFYIPRWGLYGAAFAGLLSILVQFFGSAFLIHRALARRLRMLDPMSNVTMARTVTAES